MKNRKHDIERYLRGELTPGEMHALEKEALNDPFLAEALEGVEQAGRDNFLHDLRRLNQSVHTRTRNRKKPITMWGWTAGMAAAVLLVAVSGFLVVSLLKDQASENQAMNNTPLPAPERALPADTLDVKPDSGAGRQVEKREESTAPVASRGASEEAETKSEQNKATESTTGANDLLAEKDNTPQSYRGETPKVQTTEEDVKREEEEQDIETEPQAFADTQVTDIREEEEIATEAPAKKLEGQAAGIELKRKSGAMARPLISESVILKGKVTSASDGAVLPGVNVVIKGTNIGAVTDTQGHYQLHVPPDSATLAFFFIGFEPLEMTVAKQEELDVALREDVTALSEVVVTGRDESFSDNNKPVILRLAESQGGRSALKDYLDKAVKYPQEALTNKAEGRVTVRFTVESDGQLTGFEILKDIGHGCAEELIRAIKAGPAWEPSSRGGVPFADKVRVRFRFKLP